MRTSRWVVISASFSWFLSTATPAALIDNGGGLFYDDVLKITWSQPGLLKDWTTANADVAALTTGGVSGWRLPYMSVAAGAGSVSSVIDCSSPSTTEAACRDNELGYMLYHNLGGTGSSSLFPTLMTYDPTRMVTGYYWSETKLSTNTNIAWIFTFSDGTLEGGDTTTTFPYYVWAVYDGNISAVPVPAAAWLFGSGLVGLLGLARRKH